MTRRTDYWAPDKHIEPIIIYSAFLLEITKELFRTFLLATDHLGSCLMRLCQWLLWPIAGNSQPDFLLMTGRWSDWSVITCPGVGRIYFRRRYTHDWHCQCCSVVLYPYYLYSRLSSTPACVAMGQWSTDWSLVGGGD